MSALSVACPWGQWLRIREDVPIGAIVRDTGLARTVYPLQDVRRQKTIRDVQYGAVPPGC